TPSNVLLAQGSLSRPGPAIHFHVLRTYFRIPGGGIMTHTRILGALRVPAASLSLLLVILLAAAIPIASAQDATPTADSTITSEAWSQVDGDQVMLFTLTNANGMEVKLTNYGGIINSVVVPDRDGTLGNVTLGFDNLDAYVA